MKFAKANEKLNKKFALILMPLVVPSFQLFVVVPGLKRMVLFGQFDVIDHKFSD